eukprot:1410007-Prymnesium_polylepis.1
MTETSRSASRRGTYRGSTRRWTCRPRWRRRRRHPRTRRHSPCARASGLSTCAHARHFRVPVHMPPRHARTRTRRAATSARAPPQRSCLPGVLTLPSFPSPHVALRQMHADILRFHGAAELPPYAQQALVGVAPAPAHAP